MTNSRTPADASDQDRGDGSVPVHPDDSPDQGFDTMSLATLDALRPTARPIAGAGGRDVGVVRLALQAPAALPKRRQEVAAPAPEPKGGVVIDISRKRVLLDGEVSPLTYKEFELLQFLVLREGRTIDRHE